MYPILCSQNGIYVNYYLNKVTVMVFAFSVKRHENKAYLK